MSNARHEQKHHQRAWKGERQVPDVTDSEGPAQYWEGTDLWWKCSISFQNPSWIIDTSSLTCNTRALPPLEVESVNWM